MRLTLIYPSVGRKENKPYVRAWQMQPLSMALLASLTPPEVEVRFYDDRLEEIPFDEPTDLVAISVETFTALRSYKIARAFRARRASTFATTIRNPRAKGLRRAPTTGYALTPLYSRRAAEPTS